MDIDINKKEKYQLIGQRIREAREAKGLTQAQLSEKLRPGLTATAVSLYEKGDRDVPVDFLATIAEITGVSVAYLATGKSEDTSSIHVALRADRDLWKNKKARDQVLDFIEFIKKKTSDKK